MTSCRSTAASGSNRPSERSGGSVFSSLHRGRGLRRAAEPPFRFCYRGCADAVDAFRERLPDVVEFVKAMSIAALETDGRYVASEHDSLFEDFDEGSLEREDLELFPDYLVCLDACAGKSSFTCSART